MPFVKRDSEGRIVAVSESRAEEFDEQLDADDAELTDFLRKLDTGDTALRASDQELVRVLEDLVDVLIDKGVILFTDLPVPAQAKLRERRDLREKFTRGLDLIGDD